MRELVRVFEEEVPAMVARAEGAMENSDAVGLAKAAHKVKGSVLQFSAHSAAAAAEDLEQLGKSGTLRGAESALRTLKEEVDKLLQLLHGMLREMAR
ncbi:MAG TPA: Hpt domain-containing protein [Candidatus Angelobacter sp.]|nr:Hpt domain-containing protein [Candidatus Angelobacter sp.]